MLARSIRGPRRRRGHAYFGGWGNCCCSADTTFCILVCPGTIPLYGAVVTVGASSCTTGATGCCTIAGLSGTQTVTVTFNGTTIHSASHALGGTVTIAISAPSNAKCCQGVYIPTTLTATDAIGTFTMGFWQVDGAGNFQWTGGHSATKSSLPSCPSGGTVSSGPVPVCYTFTCVLSGSPARFTLQRSWSTVNTLATGDIYWQQSYTFTPGGLCTFGPPGLCSSHNDESDGQTNAVASTTPFSINFAAMTAALANVTTDPIGGSVSISQ